MASEPPLALYARAQAYQAEIEADDACAGCNGCPGPEAKGSKCFEWKCDRPVAGRTDWPLCPTGMTRVSAHQALVERFVLARITPLSGMPEQYTDWAARGLVELHCAIRAKAEKEEKAREDARKRGTAATSTRTSAKRPPHVPKPLPRRRK